MTQFRKVLWGYDVRAVNKHIRSFKLHSELELINIQQLINKAYKERTLLLRKLDSKEYIAFIEQAATLALEEIEIKLDEEFEAQVILVDVAEEVKDELLEDNTHDLEVVGEFQVAVGLVEEVIIESEVTEQIASLPSPVQAVNVHKESAKMGRLFKFLRKMDTSLDLNNQQFIDQSQGLKYWDSIDHYLTNPDTSVEFLSTQTEITYALEQAQFVANSAVGLPRYFDYSISEVQSQVIIEPSQVKERRIRDITREVSVIKKVMSKAPEESTDLISPKSNDVSINQGSREITREVRQLRNKYIVGKLAGEDLFNNIGKIMVSKHSTITEAVIEEADQEGMLAQLIVHMTIPGLEEGV